MLTPRTVAELLGAGLSATVLLGGCSTEGERWAMADARQKAGTVQAALAWDVIYTGDADGYAHYAAQLDGVEVMKVDGTRRSTGNGVTLIIRVHGQAWEVDGTLVDIPVCYRLVYNGKHQGEPDQVDCPDVQPLAIPKDPKLPGTIRDDLISQLSSLTNPTEADVRRVVDGLNLDPRVQRDITSADDTIGIALRASRYDCTLARIKDGRLVVWRPSRIQLAPGELECNALVATGGIGQTPPH